MSADPDENLLTDIARNLRAYADQLVEAQVTTQSRTTILAHFEWRPERSQTEIRKEYRDGYRSICAEISVHFLCPGCLHSVSRHLGHHGDAGGHLPGNRHSGGVGDLAVHGPLRARDGAARHDL